MKQSAVIYWSGTGNTEAMAGAVCEGMQRAGAHAVLLTPAEVDAALIGTLDAVAFGCPAMGSEVLEEDEFEPMFSAVKPLLAGKPVGLFGSYGWGDGEWMRSWEDDCRSTGISLPCQSVICCDAPDESALDECRALGAALVK